MPRVAIPVTDVTRAGVAISEVTGNTTDNHDFAWAKNALLVARNAHATLARIVTLVIASTVDGQAPANRTVSVPALGTRYIGPFPAEVYRQAPDGKVYINVDAVDLNLAIFKLPD